MTNEEVYNGLNSENSLRVHSFMGVIPKSSDVQSIQNTIFNSLKENTDFKLYNLIVKEVNQSEELHALNLEWMAELEYKGSMVVAFFSIGKTKSINLQRMNASKGVSQYQIQEAFTNPYFLYCRQLYTDDPLNSFLLQLKIMQTIVPDSSLVLDFSSNRIFSSNWLRMVCDTNTPPTPRSLYLVQIFNSTDKEGKKAYWLRTNGLYRCGAPELEMINIQSGLQEMIQLLHATASLFVQHKIKENQVIKVGYDGLDINLTWIRWETAINRIPKDVFGGADFRKGKAESHNIFNDPTGVLFAVEEDIHTSPEIYINAVKHKPIYMMSRKEKTRQKTLAIERYSYFAKTYQKYKQEVISNELANAVPAFKKSRKNSSWQFLVRLSLSNEEDTALNQQEQLWFQVQSIQQNLVTAQLITSPYWIKNLKKGDIITTSIKESLTNWTIITPDNTEYSPETIYLLD